MSSSNYTERLAALQNIGERLVCYYCGNETPIMNNVGICSWCELALHKSPAEQKRPDSSSVEKTAAAYLHITKNEFEGASALYEELWNSTKDLGFRYVQALTLIAYSNYKTSLIRYDRPGFMEENTVFRDKATELHLRARLLLNEVLQSTKTDQPQRKAPGELHLLLLSSIKLGKLRAARTLFDRMKELGDDYLLRYDQMVMCANLDRFDETLNLAESFMSKSFFSINAFYYAALCLVEKRKLNEAQKLISMLKSRMQSSSLSSLESKINALTIA